MSHLYSFSLFASCIRTLVMHLVLFLLVSSHVLDSVLPHDCGEVTSHGMSLVGFIVNVSRRQISRHVSRHISGHFSCHVFRHSSRLSLRTWSYFFSHLLSTSSCVRTFATSRVTFFVMSSHDTSLVARQGISRAVLSPVPTLVVYVVTSLITSHGTWHTICTEAPKY